MENRNGELAIVTIGQAPRPDIEAELRAVLGELPMIVRGALDGLQLDEIRALTPIDDADTLHTRLPGGVDVVVSKKAVTDRLNELLTRLQPGPVVLACTGGFSGLAPRPATMLPSVVLRGIVDGALPEGRLGVLVPLEDQVRPFAEQWTTARRHATVVALRPGSVPDAAAAALMAAEVDLIVLDCFGYDTATLDSLRQITGRPVLSAVRLTALLAKEMLG